MNWYQSSAYDDTQKRCFHTTGLKRLRTLAKAIGFASGSFDVRSNHGGIAVSGEVTLHHEQIYVQVSQPATRADTGILIRTCKGRNRECRDESGFAAVCGALSRRLR